MGDAKSLRATEAAVLGLLAIKHWPRPWTNYELAKQAQRSLHWFWPRVERQLYNIPKRLVELGYASAHDHTTGNRPGTRYEITASGQTALHAWLGDEGRSPLFEMEQLVRVFFADQGSIGQLRTTVERMRRQSSAAQCALADIVAEVDVAGSRDRELVNALCIRLVADLNRAMTDWTDWAQQAIGGRRSPRGRWDGAAGVFDEVTAMAQLADRSRAAGTGDGGH